MFNAIVKDPREAVKDEFQRIILIAKSGQIVGDHDTDKFVDLVISAAIFEITAMLGDKTINDVVMGHIKQP